MKETPILQCRDLTKRYGNHTAVNRVSLEIQPGTIFGLIGPNGAGKSTLLKLFTSLIAPTSGTVQLHGIDVQLDPAAALRGSGAIIEWPYFYTDLSARRNLDILSGGQGPEYRRKLAEITEFMRIGHVLDQPVRTFSTGMKQRLGIALALLPESDFVILDEPTNGLDSEGIVEIRELIRSYNRTFGTTMLVTSHLLGEMEQICTDLAVLRDGRLRAIGKLEELLHHDRRLLVGCDDPGRAKLLLAGAGLPLEPLSETGDELEIALLRDCRAEVNARLVAAGIRVWKLEEKHSTLEEFFLETAGEA